MEGLRHGDQKRIAEITGLTHDFVKKVVRGVRKSDRVVEVAKQIIDERARLAYAYGRKSSRKPKASKGK